LIRRGGGRVQNPGGKKENQKACREKGAPGFCGLRRRVREGNGRKARKNAEKYSNIKKLFNNLFAQKWSKVKKNLILYQKQKSFAVLFTAFPQILWKGITTCRRLCPSPLRSWEVAGKFSKRSPEDFAAPPLFLFPRSCS
jgi:hypothetical protein